MSRRRARPSAVSQPSQGWRSRIGAARAAERMLALALVVWAIGVLAIRYAEPILDGDLFWHLKYAAQMIARGTLIPDHTLYSWTPTSSATIYCAWLGEFLLYGLYQLGGLTALFAFRYLCLALIGGLLLGYGASRGAPRLQTQAIVLTSLLAGIGGMNIKPEMLSFLAFHLILFAYCMARIADREGRDARAGFFLVPLIMVAWVNAHGGFILAAPFFAAILFGEISMRWRKADAALSKRGFQAMLVAWALSALAVVATPYGWRYPAQLIADYALHTGPRVGESWNTAYQSLLADKGFSELRDYGLVMAALAVWLLLSARRRLAATDWGLQLSVLVYVPLFFLYNRSTFYLAAVFGYAALDMLAVAAAAAKAGAPRKNRPVPTAAGPSQRAAGAITVLSMIVVGAIAIRAARLAEKGSWIGFGISYANPVVEADFLAASDLGPRLYNIFDSGGYLLWRLDPAYKVMIDPRFFPYKDWFGDLYSFSTGRNFADFQRRYPADTAIIDLDRVDVLRNFFQSPDWKLVFYGPTSAIFVRRATSDDRYPARFAEDRFDHLRNAQTALNLFDFATVVEDYPTAWKVLDQIETTLRPRVERQSLDRASALRDGYSLLAADDYDRALTAFRLAARRPIRGSREVMIVALIEQRAAALEQGDRAAIVRDEAALHKLDVAT
jgi:hypothetical protein